MYIHVYIYIYVERERERDAKGAADRRAPFDSESVANRGREKQEWTQSSQLICIHIHQLFRIQCYLFWIRYCNYWLVDMYKFLSRTIVGQLRPLRRLAGRRPTSPWRPSWQGRVWDTPGRVYGEKERERERDRDRDRERPRSLSLSLYIYIYMYVYTHIMLNKYIYIYIYTHTHTHTHVCIHIHIYI